MIVGGVLAGKVVWGLIVKRTSPCSAFRPNSNLGFSLGLNMGLNLGHNVGQTWDTGAPHPPKSGDITTLR